MAINFTGLRSLQLNSMVFRKNPYTILELKTLIQSEIEVISTETLASRDSK
jgi:hypothetical protein